MSSVRLIKKPRSIASHHGRPSVMAVAYEDKLIAYIEKSGKLQPVDTYAGKFLQHLPCIH